MAASPHDQEFAKLNQESYFSAGILRLPVTFQMRGGAAENPYIDSEIHCFAMPVENAD